MQFNQPRHHFSPPRHSKAEIALHKVLVERPLATGFKREHREGRYQLDFFFPAWKLGIEIDSEHFHDAERDTIRDGELSKIGIAILRLSNTLPAEKLREHIAYVAERIRCLPLAEKVLFIRNYKTDILDRVGPITTPPAEDAITGAHLECVDCGGSRWKMIPVWSEFYGRAEQRATRCNCSNLRVRLQEEFELMAPDEPLVKKPAVQVPLLIIDPARSA